MRRARASQSVWAETSGVESEPFLLCLRHARECADRDGAVRLSQCQKDFPARRPWAHFLEITKKGVTHLGRQRIRLRLSLLGTLHGNLFVWPVDVRKP